MRAVARGGRIDDGALPVGAPLVEQRDAVLVAVGGRLHGG